MKLGTLVISVTPSWSTSSYYIQFGEIENDFYFQYYTIKEIENSYHNVNKSYVYKVTDNKLILAML